MFGRKHIAIYISPDNIDRLKQEINRLQEEELKILSISRVIERCVQAYFNKGDVIPPETASQLSKKGEQGHKIKLNISIGIKLKDRLKDECRQRFTDDFKYKQKIKRNVRISHLIEYCVERYFEGAYR